MLVLPVGSLSGMNGIWKREKKTAKIDKRRRLERAAVPCSGPSSGLHGPLLAIGWSGHSFLGSEGKNRGKAAHFWVNSNSNIDHKAPVHQLQVDVFASIVIKVV